MLDMLLQTFSDGRLTDGRGRLVDFSQTIVIMTSNLALLTTTLPSLYKLTKPLVTTPSRRSLPSAHGKIQNSAKVILRLLLATATSQYLECRFSCMT